jgi:stage V sporulation protein D (sporulation-specific penicillin-binding protein)
MGRLGLKLGNERLYRYAVDLGFGSVTGLGFPGEASGKLRTPQHWSARSCPTVAIGYELSVTPLQLALAYAAVANGGVLMEPMLVREIEDQDGRVVRTFSPHATRRVFGRKTTEQLSTMLTAVVDSGTATLARVPGMAIAGKTGTAWKFDPRLKTYGRDKYIASFAGYAPADDPRLVGVIVIDEPRGEQYYGGKVAAPVFREVMRELMRLPHGPLDTGVEQVAVRPPSPAPVQVPDLRLLPKDQAERRLAENGLRLRLSGEGPRVLAQEPPPGTAVERGTGVMAWFSAPQDSTSDLMPDLAGLPLRQALRRLTGLQLQARIHGEGTVVRQSPAPGTRLPETRCELWCERKAPALPDGPEAPANGEVTAAAFQGPSR